MDNRSPSRHAISVKGVDECLSTSFKKVIRLEVGLPQSLTHSIELFCARSGNHKVFWLIDASDQIHVAHVGFKSLRVKSSNHRLNKVWPKSIGFVVLFIIHRSFKIFESQME
jgi:hypothetical protein